MLTSDGFYRQVDGLAMGSPPVPQLANGWMSKYNQVVKGNANIYSQYMDDVMRDIDNNNVDQKLTEINCLHPSLQFTIERETNSSIPFLDMRIKRINGTLESTWYTKPTDTGLTMNYHALVPRKY